MCTKYSDHQMSGQELACVALVRTHRTLWSPYPKMECRLHTLLTEKMFHKEEALVR